MTDIEILKQAREALINRDAVKCYDSGDIYCTCTLCEIERYISTKIELPEKSTFHSDCIPCCLYKYYLKVKNIPF